MNITIYFPVNDSTVVTVIEKGVLFGVQGAQGPTGPTGPTGPQGIPGIGIAAGGSIGQVLKKNSATDYDTSWLTLDKTAVGLSNVDNTTDLLKPISTATQTALNGKQDLATNLTSISALTFASTSFVKMTAAGTFALDTATYLTAESDTLASVTGRGATTTTAVTMAKLTLTGAVSGVGNLSSYTISNVSGLGISKQITSNFTATANGDTLIGLDINPTFNVSTYTGLNTLSIRAVGPASFNTSQIGSNTYNRGLRLISTSSFNEIFFNVLNNNNDDGQFAFGVQNATNGFAYFYNRMNGSILFGTNNTTKMQLFNTGNLVLQNSGTFTDSGFRLDVNGTARIQNQLTTTGSITAASTIARGVYMNQTLVAAANGDVLVGLDIAPTFTNGAFTGVSNLGLRVNGLSQFQTSLTIVNSGSTISVNPTGNGTTLEYISFNNGRATFGFDPTLAGCYINAPTSRSINFQLGSTLFGKFFATTGNLTLQNGGTFTDAGFRLDVNGTARVQNVLTLGSLSADPTGANGMIYYNTTTNRFKVYQNGAWATVTAI